MKTEKANQEKMIKVPESVLLALIAAKLKGKVLFPEKLERARKYVKSIVSSDL